MAYDHDPDHNNLQAVIDAGMSLGEPRALLPGESPSLIGVLVPAGADFRQVDLEKFLPAPRRKTGAAQLATAESFIDWVNRNKTPETVIFASESGTSFKAVFNEHAANRQATVGEQTAQDFAAGEPGWRDFNASYGCPLSEEWKRWHGKSQHAADVDKKVGMPHATFIQFIEDNLLDITKPANGQMLAAVRAFEAKKDVKFASAVRLDSGDVSFSYSEDTQHAGAPVDGRLVLPSEFEVTIPVFKGGQAYVIEAKLRYRITNGGLMLHYDLVRPHKSLEHAFNSVSEQIRNGTSVPMFNT